MKNCMENKMKEEWRPVRGFEEYAEISNFGQIHKFERVIYSGKNHKVKQIQEEYWTYGRENIWGYLQASIGGVCKGVHVWVYMTFYNCDIPKGMDVNHIDEDKHNNHLGNLNLMSHGDNMRYGTGIARSAAARRKVCQALNPKTLEVVMEFQSTVEAQRQGFKASAVSECCNGKRKTYKGYIWQYKDFSTG